MMINKHQQQLTMLFSPDFKVNLAVTLCDSMKLVINLAPRF